MATTSPNQGARHVAAPWPEDCLDCTTMILTFPTPAAARAAGQLVEAWRKPASGWEGSGSWLGFVYANAGILEIPGDYAGESRLSGHHVKGVLVEAGASGRDLEILLASKGASSVATWEGIREAHFPDAKLRYYVEFEEGYRVTNDEARRDKYEVECEPCNDRTAFEGACEVLGGDYAHSVSAETVVEVARAAGGEATDVEEAVDELLEREIFARPWEMCDARELD